MQLTKCFFFKTYGYEKDNVIPDSFDLLAYEYHDFSSEYFYFYYISFDDSSDNCGKGESIFIENVQECLNIIEQEAKKIPMTGVAVAAFIPGEETTDWISKMRVVGKLADDKVNLLGIAYTKAAEMAVTHQNSGNSERKDMRGEYGYEGGVIKPVNGGYLICAFSGGKSEDDVYAAQKGLDWLASKFQ